MASVDFTVSSQDIPEIEYRLAPGFPAYRVGSDGSVWCGLGRGPAPKGGKTMMAWRSVKPSVPRGRRYAQVNLHGKFKRDVHTLVALTFLGHREQGQEVAHLNGNSLDNRICNLAYVTHIENEQHKIIHGTRPRGESIKRSKLKEREVKEIIGRVRNGETQRSVARMYDVSEATVSLIMSGKNWAHVGASA